MDQIKKDPNDPDFDQLNPKILKMAKNNGFVRQPIELYLTGNLTWKEALETIAIFLYDQFKETQKLCTDILSERPTTAILLASGSGGLIKALPKHPFDHEESSKATEGAN
jgi:hypothetical protein